jgi:hypothetical protein
MHNTPKTVPAFYDPEPGAPPLFPPMLTDQLELFGKDNHRPTTLIADKILVPKVSIVAPTTKPLSTPAPEFKIAKRPLKHFESASSPYPKKVAFMSSRSQTPMPSDLNGSSDSLSDSGSSSSSSMNLLENSKIPKPIGEPGHPGRGGYTLDEALDWNPKTYGKFKVRKVCPSACKEFMNN